MAYNCTVSSVTTRTRWRVSYRYSEFLALRKKVEDLWTCKAKEWSGSCQAIRDATAAFFSKETPSNDLEAVSSDQTSSSEARKRAGAFAPTCPVARECNEVRSCASETTASSVQVPWCQTQSPVGYQELGGCHGRLHAGASKPDEEKVNFLSLVVSTSKNVYRRWSDGCRPSMLAVAIAQFYCSANTPSTASAFQYDCPVCRAQVGVSAVANYCRPKNQVQWWLTDFKENPLNSAALQVTGRTASLQLL
uniref:PX domain-containing protein n=1 Tax=Hyaloperonospora arabidopsidis (strain Emoy2) TaxID=559515 RepID=M4BB81_HYAAE